MVNLIFFFSVFMPWYVVFIELNSDSQSYCVVVIWLSKKLELGISLMQCCEEIRDMKF